MILVDTAVWIDHLSSADPLLQHLLLQRSVLGHSFVLGELAIGSLKRRKTILIEIESLPQAIVASDFEVRHFIESHSLYGRGIGYIDAHLLASVRLTPEAQLWTRDKRLHGIAAAMSIAFNEPEPRTQ